MKLSLTEDLRTTAVRCVWFEPPEQAIADPVRFAAYVLTYGTHDDVKALRRQMDDDQLRHALDNAPPGIFDARSWSYWNIMLHGDTRRPLPQRRLAHPAP